MFKKILIGLIVVILIFVIVVALQRSTYSVQRSSTIDAPPAAVFAAMNDFHNWEAWSPWAKLDPDAKNTFSGEESGKGAVFAWDGNDDVGEGQMTITESRPNELVQIHLEFMRPMADECTTKFTFAPNGEGTEVTWNMSGENNFIGKAFCLFMNMDEIVGKDFEKGLANMKAEVEKSVNHESANPSEKQPAETNPATPTDDDAPTTNEPVE